MVGPNSFVQVCAIRNPWDDPNLNLCLPTGISYWGAMRLSPMSNCFKLIIHLKQRSVCLLGFIVCLSLPAFFPCFAFSPLSSPPGSDPCLFWTLYPPACPSVMIAARRGFSHMNFIIIPFSSRIQIQCVCLDVHETPWTPLAQWKPEWYATTLFCQGHPNLSGHRKAQGAWLSLEVAVALLWIFSLYWLLVERQGPFYSMSGWGKIYVHFFQCSIDLITCFMQINYMNW